MTRRPSTWTRWTLAAALPLLTAAGCSIKSETAPSRFYLLRPLPADADQVPPGSSTDPVIALGPVEIPAHLDRPQIVTRTAGAEVKLSEFERWAEPLDDNIAAVLAENLSGLVPTKVVSPYPSRLPPDLDLRVAVEVLRFDGSLSEEAVLDARWRILDRDDLPLRTERSRLTQPVSGDGYDALVDAMSRALGLLSREIAQEIRRTLRAG